MPMNDIHTVKVGDLVRREGYSRLGKLYMVTEVIGDRCAFNTHEMTLGLWEVTAPTQYTYFSPAPLYYIVGGDYEAGLYDPENGSPY